VVRWCGFGTADRRKAVSGFSGDGQLGGAWQGKAGWQARRIEVQSLLRGSTVAWMTAMVDGGHGGR